MANALYDKGREGYLAGDIDWDADTIRAILVRTSGGGTGPYYTKDLAAHANLSDIPDNVDCRPLGSGASTGVALAGKTVTDGVADADPADFGLVTAGDAIQLLVLYKDTGTQSTSRLIAAIDTATGLPVTPSGGNVTVNWSGGADKIFKL